MFAFLFGLILIIILAVIALPIIGFVFNLIGSAIAWVCNELFNK